MTTTTYPQFDGNTEALEVAKAFADSVRGKNILVTGVNRGGIGFTTAEAFVSFDSHHSHHFHISRSMVLTFRP